MAAFLYHVWLFSRRFGLLVRHVLFEHWKALFLEIAGEILVHFRIQVGIPVDLDEGVLKMVLSEPKLSSGWNLPSSEDFL